MSEFRYFIKVHTGFPEHRKTVGLSDRAFRGLVTAWCYCARNLNDGELTDAQISQLFSQKIRDELVAAGWLHRCDSGWEMHDYLDHQSSAAQVADLRKKRAAAGRRGGQAKANHLASATASALANAKQTASKNVAEVEVEEEQETTTTTTTKTPSSAEPMAYSQAFLDFWATYPRKVGKDAAWRAFEKARKHADPHAILTGVTRLAGDPNLPDTQFIPHAATWLARGGWGDDPYPPHTNGRPKPSTTDERVNHGLEMARRYAEQEAREEQQRLEIAR